MVNLHVLLITSPSLNLSNSGTIASGSVGYVQYANLSQESARMKRLKMVYDVRVLPAIF